MGARPSSILAQFVAEALTLSMIGGVLGVVIGLLLARVAAARLGWSYAPRADTAIVAFAFSVLVGLVFGLYPARKAARLDPIDALRFE